METGYPVKHQAATEYERSGQRDPEGPGCSEPPPLAHNVQVAIEGSCDVHERGDAKGNVLDVADKIEIIYLIGQIVEVAA
jgi:hypothetical protein